MGKKDEILRLPLEVRVDMAFKAAVAKLITKCRKTGRKLFVWQDGKVVELDPAELTIVAEDEPTYGNNQ